MITRDISTYGQTLFDIAIQQTGGIEGVFNLLANNEWEDGVNHNMQVGETYQFDSEEITNKDILQYFTINKLVPNSGEEFVAFVPFGIYGLMEAYLAMVNYMDWVGNDYIETWHNVNDDKLLEQSISGKRPQQDPNISLGFDGNDFLSSNAPFFKTLPLNTFSISTWFWVGALGGPQSLFGVWNAGIDQRSWNIYISPTKLSFLLSYDGDNVESINYSTNLLAQTWNHAYVEVNYTTMTFGLSLNNAPLQLSPFTAVHQSTAPFTMGMMAHGGFPLTGQIQDVYIYNKLLTQPERTNLFNNSQRF